MSIKFDIEEDAFIIDDEDHTIGNLLQHHLLLNDNVTFAGYKMFSPLERTMLLRLQVLPSSKGSVLLLDDTLGELLKIVETMETNFVQNVTSS